MSIAHLNDWGIEESAPWIAHYPDCIPSKLDYPAEPLWWLLERAAQTHGDRVACKFYRESLTWRELYNQARRAATLFRRMGVRPGDRVGLLLPNCPEYLIAAYGIWMVGGVVVSLSPLMVAEEVSQLLDSTNCRIVVATDLLAPLAMTGSRKAEKILTCSLARHFGIFKRMGYNLLRWRKLGLKAWLTGVPMLDFLKEIRRVEPMPDPRLTPLDSPAFIIPTGGTTGRAKCVTLTHRSLMANAWQIYHWCGKRTGKDVMLAVIPFFHSYGLSTCLTTGTAMAATLVLHPRFEAEAVLNLFRHHKITVFPAVPAMLHVLNQRLRTIKDDLRTLFKSLLWVISGGASLDPVVGQEFAEHTKSLVVEGYGLSEASPVTHVGPLDGSARPGTMGLPLPDTDARIVDAETGSMELPPGEVGELIVRGPQVMAGYFNDPLATANAIRDGWLYTGDLAIRDADGFFRIVDRKKDLIITSGFNVYPSDVESVIRKFPGVADVAVIGIPDPQRGELVKAVIAVKDSEHFHRSKLDAFLEEHLSKYKVPKLIEIHDRDLPRNFLGKVLRRKLRESPDNSSLG